VSVAVAEEAYPAWWLPELNDRRARAAVEAQTPADWMLENAPDPAAHRNGTAPAGSPDGAAYPAEWLQGLNIGEPPHGGLGGEGYLNVRRAA
jgi:hypothetical protein